jgi:hypothetical protein
MYSESNEISFAIRYVPHQGGTVRNQCVSAWYVAKNVEEFKESPG